MTRPELLVHLPARSAPSVPAHKLGRTVYFMLERGKAFDRERLVATAI